MKVEDYIEKAERIAPISDEKPDKEFLDFYKRNRRMMGDILLDLKDGDSKIQGFILRAGMMGEAISILESLNMIRQWVPLPLRQRGTPPRLRSLQPMGEAVWKIRRGFPSKREA